MTNLRFTPRVAVRKGQRLRLAIDGPTGSGKTYTALMFAERFVDGDMSNVLVVDTERGSSQLYADRFGAFDVVEWTPPFDPRDLRTHLAVWAENYEVIVVDSLTHFWAGDGGTLDIVDTAAKRQFGGNSFAGWSEGTPAQNDMVDALVSVDAHLIATMRSKMEYVLDEQRRPQKIGMAPVQRAGLEYEFTVVADMDLAHTLTVGKSRCDMIADGVYRLGHHAEVVDTLHKWLGEAAPMASPDQLDTMRGLVTLAPSDAQGTVRAKVRELFGEPRTMTAEQADAAIVWLKDGLAEERPGSSEPVAEVVDDDSHVDDPADARGDELAVDAANVTDVDGLAESWTVAELDAACVHLGHPVVAKAKGSRASKIAVLAGKLGLDLNDADDADTFGMIVEQAVVDAMGGAES